MEGRIEGLYQNRCSDFHKEGVNLTADGHRFTQMNADEGWQGKILETQMDHRFTQMNADKGRAGS